MLPDPALRRVERNAVLVCAGMALAAVVFGRFDIAAGVVGGGLLSAASYASIGAGISALTTAAAAAGTNHRSPLPNSKSQTQDPRVDGPELESAEPRAKVTPWTVLKVALRYALLGLLAYVMIARLRLHPVGLLAGVSSVVAAVFIEAGRLLTKKS